MTKCPECSDTGERDSGGMHPWGESILLPCDCKDAEIGRQWREDSSLEKWFPITAERMAALEAKNAETGMEELRKSIAEILGEPPTWPEHGNVALAVSAIVALLHASCERMQKEIERHKPLMQAVEWILEDGHMNQEHLARLRAAWEAA